MEQPLVSVITPVYNAERFLRETMESVVNQTYKNLEYILVDDGSKDSSKQIIQEYMTRDSRILLLEHEVNQGIAQTRNDGILRATGKYIAFVDSDDVWVLDKLEKQIAFMEQNNVEFSYAAYDITDEEGNYIKHIKPYKERVCYEQLLNTNMIACCTVVIKSDIMKRNLMPELKHEDYATWLNVLKNDVKEAIQAEGTLARYRRVKSSVSSNKLRTIAWNWKIYFVNQKLGFFRSIRQICMFIFYTGRKYI